ncbi:MAG: glycosyltransferase family 9 protein [Alphaproteobacteria bacterium]
MIKSPPHNIDSSDSLDSFAAWHHDIHNLIGLYKGYVELLAKPDLAPEKRAEYANILQKNFDLLQLMVGCDQALYDINHIFKGLTPLDYLGHLSSLYQLKMIGKAQDIAIHCAFDRELIPLKWRYVLDDKERLASFHRIVSNLIDNAVRHGDSDSKIRVHVMADGLWVANDMNEATASAGQGSMGEKIARNHSEDHGFELTLYQDHHPQSGRSHAALVALPPLPEDQLDAAQMNALADQRIQAFIAYAPAKGDTQQALAQAAKDAFNKQDYGDALAQFSHVIHRGEEDRDIWLHLASTLAAMGDIAAAKQGFRLALFKKARPLYARLGLMRLALQQAAWMEALAELEQMAAYAKKHAISFEQGMKFAGDFHDQLLSINPAAPPFILRRILEAGKGLSPASKQYLANRARIYRAKGFNDHDVMQVDLWLSLYMAERDYIKASALLERHLKIMPNNISFIANHAQLLTYQGEYQAAYDCLNAAILKFGAQPALISQLGYVQIHYGNYKDGYQNCALAWDHPEFMASDISVNPVILSRPRLTKDTDIKDKTILIFVRQGFGNMIQYMRFISALKDLSPKALMLISTPDKQAIRTYFKQTVPELTIIDQPDRNLQADYWVVNEHLPAFFGVNSIKDIPSPLEAVPDQQRVHYWQQWLDQKIPATAIKIAIAVGGERSNHNDSLRSMKLEMLYDALNDHLGSKACLINLQSWLLQADQDFINAHDEVLDPMPEIVDFMDSVALLSHVDLVIAVDSGLVHLAASQGLPVWAMLYDPPEYRWPATGSDYGWYPSLKLYRQQGRGIDQQGDWQAVLSQISHDLGHFIKEYKHNE